MTGFSLRAIAALLLIIVLGSSVSAHTDADLEAIRRAIEERGSKWTAGPGLMWNLTRDEARLRRGWIRESADPQRMDPPDYGSSRQLPLQFDWRDVGGASYITPIRDQADCGSCWAFGAVASMESRIAIALSVANPIVDLSEQYLVSCSNGDCDGYGSSGTSYFLQYIGTIAESCMPYQAVDTIPCEDHCPWGDMEIMQLDEWGYTNETIDGIKERCLEGPVYVGYDYYEDFDAYDGGVYEHLWGEQTGGHAVSVIGWSDPDSCWICKNSWGPDWGENGYFRIKYGQCRIEEGSVWMVPQPARYPNLTVSPVILHESVGDGDGVANPGEHATLEFWVIASPYWAMADGVTLTLEPSPASGDVDVLEGTAILETTIVPGDSVLCSGVLEIAIGENGPATDLPLALTLRSDIGGEDEYGKTITIYVKPSLNLPGWPVVETEEFSGTAACFAVDQGMVTACADKNGNVYILDATGEVMNGWPQIAEGSIRGSCAVADMTGDWSPELIVGTMANTLEAYTLTGERVCYAELDRSVVAPPMAVDLDGDEVPEIIVGTLGGNLWAVDYQGEPLPGWPVDLGLGIISGAALVQHDGMHYVCCGTMAGSVYLLDAMGQLLPGWPVELGSDVWAAPVTVELSDGSAPLIFCPAERAVHLLTMLGDDTELFSGSSPIRSPLLVLDLDNDELPEIAFATSDMTLHVLNQQGEYLPGWPQTFQGSTYSGLAALELDGIAPPELVYSSDNGLVYLLDSEGTILPPSPIDTGSPLLSQPTLTDLENDGDMEIVIGTENGMLALDHKQSGTAPVWSTHRVDITRSGFCGTVTASAPPTGRIPAVAELQLLSYHPTPSNNVVTFRFVAPTSKLVSITLYDMLGRRCVEESVTPLEGITEHVLSLRSLPAGTYQVALRSGKRSETTTVLHLP